MTPEGKVKYKIKTWLKINMPGHWQVSVRGGAFGKAGTPDLLICWMGIFIAIEIKTFDGVVSALQNVQLHLIREAGGVAAIVRGYDVARLEAIKRAVLAKCHSQ